MKSNKLKKQIQMFVLGLFGIAIAFLLIRGFLIIIGSNPNAPFVVFWNDKLTAPLIYPFQNIYDDWVLGAARIELATVLAIFIDLVSALLVTKVIGTFFNNDPKELLVDIVDSMFKVAEYVLIFRFMFRLTHASLEASFVKLIVSYMSEIVYKPFVGILPGQKFGPNGDFVFETSTLVAIIIIIVLDIVAESIMYGIMNDKDEDKNNQNQMPQQGWTNVTNVQQPMPQQGYAYPPQQQQPQNMHININVPPYGQQQQQQQQQIPYQENRQIVNVNEERKGLKKLFQPKKS